MKRMKTLKMSIDFLERTKFLNKKMKNIVTYFLGTEYSGGYHAETIYFFSFIDKRRNFYLITLRCKLHLLEGL